MMRTILFFLLLTFNNVLFAENNKCETAIQKLKPSCNIIGKGVNKLKEFSKNNQTIDQSFKNIREKIDKRK